MCSKNSESLQYASRSNGKFSIYTNLFAAFTDACVISSIHRLSLLERFDEVLVMQEGRLVAQGTMEELALSCPEFQRLTSLQKPHSEEFPVGRVSAA